MNVGQSTQDPVPALDLARFGVSATRGFLPDEDPCADLPAHFATLERCGDMLPRVLAAQQVAAMVAELPPPDLSALAELTDLEARRAFTRYTFLHQAYILERWQKDGRPRPSVPSQIAIPECVLAKRLGLQPVLSYSPYCLWNWTRRDRNGPVDLDNIMLLQNFLGGQDEEWFILVHVALEARAAGAIRSIGMAQQGVYMDDPNRVENALEMMAESLQQMNATMNRMPERCNPFIYFLRVRPYLMGSTRYLLIYEGVEEFGEKPQQFIGETGAQTPTFACLDAALGVEHKDPWPFIDRMKDYMPPAHRQFLMAVGSGPSIREFALKNPSLWSAYNNAVQGIVDFRQTHLRYADEYIARQVGKGNDANSTMYGTGGTEHIQYLRKHLADTMDALIR